MSGDEALEAIKERIAAERIQAELEAERILREAEQAEQEQQT